MSVGTSKRAWLTRDAVPSSTSKTIGLPDDPLWQADFFGAVLELTRVYRWEKRGTLEPEQMAAAWLEIVLNWMEP